MGTARPAASAYEPAAHHLIKVCLDEYIYRYIYDMLFSPVDLVFTYFLHLFRRIITVAV